MVLIVMVEDLTRLKAPLARETVEAMRWASIRALHWLSEARRCGQESVRLRCLAEAACSNMALRGLLYEEGEAMGSRHQRWQELILAQSFKLGRLLSQLCESTGRAAARAALDQKTGHGK